MPFSLVIDLNVIQLSERESTKMYKFYILELGFDDQFGRSKKLKSNLDDYISSFEQNGSNFINLLDISLQSMLFVFSKVASHSFIFSKTKLTLLKLQETVASISITFIFRYSPADPFLRLIISLFAQSITFELSCNKKFVIFASFQLRKDINRTVAFMIESPYWSSTILLQID